MDLETKEERKQWKRARKALQNHARVSLCLIIFTVIASVAAFALVITLGVVATQRSNYIPTPAITTTTKDPNVTYFAIGQYCLYNNQCPEKAICSGTCQCPVHFYYNSSRGNCTLRKSNGVACSNDFECNNKLGLRCISGTCQCETVRNFWNSTYNTAGMVGRCQKKKTHGMQCSGSDGASGINYWGSGNWGSQVTR